MTPVAKAGVASKERRTALQRLFAWVDAGEKPQVRTAVARVPTSLSSR